MGGAETPVPLCGTTQRRANRRYAVRNPVTRNAGKGECDALLVSFDESLGFHSRRGFSVLGITAEFSDRRVEGMTWAIYTVAAICWLIAAYCVFMRYVAVTRFKLIFLFLPSAEEYEERFRHLVEKEIRSRATALQAAYRRKDAARDAMGQAEDALGAMIRLKSYQEAGRSADSCSRCFHRAIDTTTSKWLPAPYKKISRNFSDWVPRQP